MLTNSVGGNPAALMQANALSQFFQQIQQNKLNQFHQNQPASGGASGEQDQQKHDTFQQRLEALTQQLIATQRQNQIQQQQLQQVLMAYNQSMHQLHQKQGGIQHRGNSPMSMQTVMQNPHLYHMHMMKNFGLVQNGFNFAHANEARNELV